MQENKTLQRYIRLLAYENALKVIDYVESLKVYENYANMTAGGLSLQILEKDFDKVIEFLNSLEVRYELGTEHPSKVEARIIKDFKTNDLEYE